jgi:putative (di)nucleoside polyphosphate hydrolase
MTIDLTPPFRAEPPEGYRRNVGIMLLNNDGHAFVGRRIDMVEHAWQMPQGGIDAGEEPAVAALRELEEEVGTARAVIIAETPGWLSYDLPAELAGNLWKGKWKGQAQKWFAMRFTGADQDISIDTGHPEFDAWRWVPRADLPGLIVPFKRPVYEAVLAVLEPRLKLIGF